jgi:hypothetical protein
MTQDRGKLGDLDLRSLVGLPVEQARERISDAGGEVRTVPPDGMVTLDFRATRVTLIVDHETVLDVRGPG